VAEGCGAGASFHRGHCIRVSRRRRGWAVRIIPVAPVPARPPIQLRNNVPQGRAALMAEARAWIDRLLDGPPWQGQP
jgi:hypothetical protein